MASRYAFAAMSAPFVDLYIDGKFRPASTGETYEVRNPYTNEVASIAASASLEDCAAAVDAAGRAFKTWEHSPFALRRQIFLKAAELLGSSTYIDKAVEAEKAETAAVETWSRGSVVNVKGTLEGAAGLLNELKGETFPSTRPGGHVIAQRRAMGVMSVVIPRSSPVVDALVDSYAISPWNAPLFLSIRAIAIPIICGNTVVLKSSEFSPRSQAIVAEAFHEVIWVASITEL